MNESSSFFENKNEFPSRFSAEYDIDGINSLISGIVSYILYDSSNLCLRILLYK